MISTLILRIAAAAIALLAASAATAQDFVLAPGDTVSVSVLEDPSLGGSALVRPDGKITLPLVGSVQAAGRTPEALQAAIRSALARDFVEPPTVTVALTRLGAETLAGQQIEGFSTIYVLGQVGAPGRIDVETPIDILQALALAGGPGVFAATDRIQVRRRVDGRDMLMLFDYEKVEDGVLPLDPISLVDGDVIVVPERGLFD